MDRLSVHRHCPKCNGNLYLDSDFHGWYEQCLQCGYIRDMVAVCKDPKVVSNTKDSIQELVSQI